MTSSIDAISPSLTINAGLRFDHSRAISQDLHALDPEGRQTDDIVRGLGTLYTWNVWSPRLGVTMKHTADGRTMLRAGYGRFSRSERGGAGQHDRWCAVPHRGLHRTLRIVRTERLG